MRTSLFFLPLKNSIKLHSPLKTSRKYGSTPEECRFTLEEFREKVFFPCSPLKNSIFFVSAPNEILHKLTFTPEQFHRSSTGGREARRGSGQRAKKVVSDSPGLVGLVNSVLNVKYLEEFNLQKNCEINSAHYKKFGGWLK